MNVSGRVSRAIALAVAFLLLVALVVIAEISQSAQKQINRAISLSQQRQVLLVELLRELSDAEAGQRGYLLTDDEMYLQSYQAARDRVEPTLDRITNLFRDNDRLLVILDQRDVVRHLRVLVGAKLGELAASVALHSSQGSEQALALMRTDLGSRTMSEVRDETLTLRNMEQDAVNMALARAARLQLVSRVLMGGVALLNLALLILAAALWARQARRRAELTEQLAIENEELERRVRRRTTELSALSSHLQQLTEKEKASLARELHDELGGLLIAVKMDVTLAAEALAEPQSRHPVALDAHHQGARRRCRLQAPRRREPATDAARQHGPAAGGALDHAGDLRPRRTAIHRSLSGAGAAADRRRRDHGRFGWCRNR